MQTPMQTHPRQSTPCVRAVLNQLLLILVPADTANPEAGLLHKHYCMVRDRLRPLSLWPNRQGRVPLSLAMSR
jgi:hypothetical protein